MGPQVGDMLYPGQTISLCPHAVMCGLAAPIRTVDPGFEFIPPAQRGYIVQCTRCPEMPRLLIRPHYGDREQDFMWVVAGFWTEEEWRASLRPGG